jgi:serine/threonine protein kinase
VSEPGSELDPVGKLAESFLARYRRGERPSLTEYTEQYPDLAKQILEVFPALVMVEELGSVGGPEVDARADSRVDKRAAPRQLGEYRILREVGRGGMGIVYEAVQESLGRHVALKVFPEHGLLSPAHLERFRRESKAAAQLHHTNIVPVFGVGEHEGVHYYAMQFIPGQGLDLVLKELQRLRAQQGWSIPESLEHGGDRSIAQGLFSGHWPGSAAPLGEPDSSSEVAAVPGASVSQSAAPGSRQEPTGKSTAEYFRSVARMGLQVAEALTHAHQQGILHRDIKPSNLLLDVRGTVWVTDFGLAKTEGTEDLTNTGDIVGTLRYMAPERFNGWSDPRSDVYGLGITLYEMLTLRPAFQDSHRPRLIGRVLHDDPPRPRKLDPHIPRDLETIILKAIAKEPADRYQTAEALAEDLRRFLEDRTIQARRSSTSERTWRWCRRNPLVASLGVALGLILSGSVIGLTVLYLSADAQRGRAEEAEENWKIAATEARAGEAKARQAEAESKAVLDFFQDRILAAARPTGHPGGLGRETTIRAAIDHAEPDIERSFAGQPLAEASIREVLGLTYYSLDDMPKAIKQHERGLALRQAHLPADDPETLSSMGSLAIDYQVVGRLPEALRLHEQTLNLRKVVLGPTHLKTVSSTVYLATTLEGLGRGSEALPLYEEALRLNRVARPDGVETVETMVNLATAYTQRGRSMEAMQLFEEARKLLPAAKPGGAGFDKFWTTDHLTHNLAIAFYEANRYTEAAALHEETLKRRRAILGPDHNETLNSLSNLAAVFVDAGRHSEALPLLEEALRLQKAKAGPDDSATLHCMGNLAVLYRYLGRLEEAWPLFQKTLEGQKAKLGADHPVRLAFMNHAVVCLLKMKRFDEALILVRDCLAMRTRKDAADWGVFRTKLQLGQAMTGLKHYAEAEALLLEAHRELSARKESIPVWTHRFIGEAVQSLVDLYEVSGKKNEAAQWRQKLDRPESNKGKP